MKTVWKYPLRSGLNELLLPTEMTPLAVACQGDPDSTGYQIVLWVLVDPKAQHTKPFTFAVVTTGMEFCEEHAERYVGSLTVPSKDFPATGVVFHVFQST